jgi:xylulokinase
MTPKWIAGARGSFSGLTASHGAAHLARAVLEGTAFAMRDIVDQLEALGVATDRVRLMGGGAQSAVWCQIRADLIGRPVEVLSESDASATGAALIAAVAAGLSADIKAATSALPLPLRRVEPNAATREAYKEAYARYRETFAAMEPVWARS